MSSIFEPFWDVNQRRLDVVRSAQCASRPEIAEVALPEGCFEFVGGLLDCVGDGRFFF